MDSEKLYEAGLEKFEQKLFAEADTCFNKVVEQDPTSTEGWYWKARVAEEMKNYNKAAEFYDKVIELDDESDIQIAARYFRMNLDITG